MRRRHMALVGVPVTALAAVCSLGMATTAPTASAATQAHAARTLAYAPDAVQPPRGKPALNATFRGSRLNTRLWDTCYPKMASYNGGCQNWGNHEEAEWYLRSQVRVGGGVVRLVAQRERTVGTTSTGARKVYGCRSGMITSYPGFKFRYGFVQVVANIPHGRGLWPALWLAAASGKYPPEIDMVESWGVNVLTGSFYHPVIGRRSRATYSPALTRGWQTYSLSWTRSSLRYWVGNRLVLTVRRNVPHQLMYFLADLAEYLPANRGFCTGQLVIRSVKIWKA